ncbi:MAG: hypothetical protein EPO42_09425 [Gallionellaceae bacterium]|nr:MAG: hypothetical protein EPO42_09425 [Gallionellaceae bacterium]
MTEQTLTGNRWLSSFAPVTIIIIAALVAAGLAVASTMLALSGSWLGVVFDRIYGGAGVRVEQVMDNSPVAGILRDGDIITAFVTPSHGRVDVPAIATLEDPDQLGSYAEYNAFFALQQAVWEAISSPSFTAILSDGRSVKLTSADFPGPAVLPAAFWWLLLFGGASFLLGVSVWSMRSQDPVTRMLAISGTGFMVGAYCCAIYIAREIAMPAKLFFGLASANHLGIMVFAYAAILFLWFYPQRLGKGPAAWIFLSGVAAIWLNETLQWLSWPVHTFYAHFVVAYFLLVLFSIMQWRKLSAVPRERAMLRWLLSTMLLSLGFAIALFYAPIILAGKPIASTVLTFGSIFVFYLGLVIGTIRYRQFDMQHWWITAWQWLIFILIVLAADALFFYFMHLADAVSSGLAIGVGCIYLLARRWFWGRYSGNSSRALDHALPHLVDALMLQQKSIAPDQQWRQTIERVFNPLTVKAIPDRRDMATIARGGLALQLPSLDGLEAMELFCCDRGKRLFISTDVRLADQLLELMRYSRDIIVAREQGIVDPNFQTVN